MNGSFSWMTTLLLLALNHSAWSAAETTPVTSLGLHPLLNRILEDFEGFSAHAAVTIRGSTEAETIGMPMTVAFLDGDMRAEINMANVRSAALPAEMIQTLRQIGMDQVITIMRARDGAGLILYPNLKASVTTPALKNNAGRPAPRRIQEIRLGEELIEGQLCEKVKLLYRSDQRTEEAVVWRARALNRFPLQIHLEQGGQTLEVRYSDLQLTRPARELFLAPSGFKAYPSMEKVMEAAVARLAPPAKTPPVTNPPTPPK